MNFSFTEKKKTRHPTFGELGAPCLYMFKKMFGTLWNRGGCHVSVIWHLEHCYILVPYISLHKILILNLRSSRTCCHSHPVSCPHRGSDPYCPIKFFPVLALISCNFLHAHFSAWFDRLHIPSRPNPCSNTPDSNNQLGIMCYSCLNPVFCSTETPKNLKQAVPRTKI